VAHYLLAALSMISGFLYFQRLAFRWNLNHAAFLTQILKLIHAGNLQRALKLCKAVPDPPYVQVVKAVLLAAGGSPEDPVGALAQAARGPFVAAMGALNRWSMLGGASGVLAVAALAVGPPLGRSPEPGRRGAGPARRLHRSAHPRRPPGAADRPPPHHHRADDRRGAGRGRDHRGARRGARLIALTQGPDASSVAFSELVNLEVVDNSFGQ